MKRIGLVVVLWIALFLAVAIPLSAVETQKETGAFPVAYVEYVGSESEDACINCTIEVGITVHHSAPITNYPISFTLTLPLYLESQGLRYLGHTETAGFRNLTWSNWGGVYTVTGEIYQDTGVGYDIISISYQPLDPQGAYRAAFSYIDDLGNPYTKIMTIIVGGPDEVWPPIFIPLFVNCCQ